MTRSLVERQFGAHAAGYVTSPVHARGASLQRLVELVRPQRHWQVLDVAAAAGHTALAFAPHVAHVTASDVTDEMLAEAAKLAAARGIANISTVKADAETLPFADAVFDLVTCRIAAHHFPRVPRFAAEAGRVLKPGGLFALVDNISPDAETTPGFPPDELGRAAAAYNAFEKLRDPSHVRCLTIGEWGETIAGAGLSLLRAERLPKEMELAAWAERMGVAPDTTARLQSMLTEAAPALRAFLKPRLQDGALLFTLEEALIIARKPG